MPSSFTGHLSTGPGRITPVGLSTNVDGGGPFSTTRLISVTSGGLKGTRTPGGSGAVGRSLTGGKCELFGGRLFERIIVIPRVQDLKFILTDTEFPIEVWNTFHDAAKSLTAISLGGVGGIVLTNPYTLPKSIGPKDSLIFQAVMPSSGPSGISQTVTFTFAGITGTDAVFTGSRILVFTVPPDWQDGVTETISYLTDILVARTDAEQRRGLRRRARRGLSFTAKTIEARDAAGLEALLWGWQHLPYGVPFWPDAQPLTVDTPAGALSIPVDTTDRLFAVDGVVLLWHDEFIFEALTINSVSAGSLGVSSPTQLDWKAGFSTFVIPVFQGRLSEAIDLTRLWSGADQVAVSFEGEAEQIADEPTVTFPQFKGFDVLEIAPNWADDLHRQYKRSIIKMDSGVGEITVRDKGGSPVVSHTLPWFIETHPAATQLRGFLNRRLGRLVPFWCPTYDQDLVLALDTLAGHNQLTVKAVNYSRFFFPNRSRRFLALLRADGSTKEYVEVTASVDIADGTEGLTLSANLSFDALAGATMVSFLTFGRLQDDAVAIAWDTREVGEAEVAIQELPREVPV